MNKYQCLRTSTRLILNSLLILVSYVEISHSQTDVYCVDPHTGLHYPVNSTWPSSTFCGTYTCNARLVPKPGSSQELTSEPYLQENKILKDASKAYELLKSKLKNKHAQDPSEKKDNDADTHIKLSKAKDFLSLYEAVNKLANFIEEKSNKDDSIKIKNKNGKNSIPNKSSKESKNNDESDRIAKIKDLYEVANQMADALENKLLNEKNTEFKVNTIHLNNLLNIYQEIASLARNEILNTESSNSHKSQSIKRTLDSFYSDYYKYLQHYYSLYPDALVNDKEQSFTQNPMPISDSDISATNQDEIYYYVDDASGKVQQVAVPRQTQNINVPEKMLYSDKNFNYWNVNGFQFPPNQDIIRSSGSEVNQNSVPPSGYPNSELIDRQSQDNNNNTQQTNNDSTSQQQSSVLLSSLVNSVQQPQPASSQSNQGTQTVPPTNAQQSNNDPLNQAMAGVFSNLMNSIQQPQSPNNQTNITASSPQPNDTVIANNSISNNAQSQSYNEYYENYYKNYTQQYYQYYGTNNSSQYQVPQAYSGVQAQSLLGNNSNSSLNAYSNYPVQVTNNSYSHYPVQATNNAYSNYPVQATNNAYSNYPVQATNNAYSNYPVQATNNDYQNYYNNNPPQSTQNQIVAPQAAADYNTYYPQSNTSQTTATDYQNYYNNYLAQAQNTQNQNVSQQAVPNAVVEQNPSPNSFYPASASSTPDSVENTTPDNLSEYYDYYITYPTKSPNNNDGVVKPFKGVSYYGYDPQQGKYVLKTPKDTDEYYQFLREYLDVISDYQRMNNTNAALDSQNSASEVQHTFYAKFDDINDYPKTAINMKVINDPDVVLQVSSKSQNNRKDSSGAEHVFNPGEPDFPSLKRSSRQINPLVSLNEEDKPENLKMLETFITVNGCPETLEPGYFQAGDKEQHFPKCCPHKIED